MHQKRKRMRCYQKHVEAVLIKKKTSRGENFNLCIKNLGHGLNFRLDTGELANY